MSVVATGTKVKVDPRTLNFGKRKRKYSYIDRMSMDKVSRIWNCHLEGVKEIIVKDGVVKDGITRVLAAIRLGLAEIEVLVV